MSERACLCTETSTRDCPAHRNGAADPSPPRDALDLDGIDERANAAKTIAPGDWTAGNVACGNSTVVFVDGWGEIATVRVAHPTPFPATGAVPPEEYALAAHIAGLSPNVELALVAELRRLRAEVEAVSEALEAAKCPAYEDAAPTTRQRRYREIPDAERVQRLAVERDRLRVEVEGAAVDLMCDVPASQCDAGEATDRICAAAALAAERAAIRAELQAEWERVTRGKTVEKRGYRLGLRAAMAIVAGRGAGAPRGKD